MKSLIFSHNLKRTVKKHGLKVREISKSLGMSQPTYISKVKTCNFTILELIELENILNTTFAELCTKIEGYNYKPFNTVKKVIKQESKNKTQGSKYDYLNKL